jgi:hypothetical protein
VSRTIIRFQRILQQDPLPALEKFHLENAPPPNNHPNARQTHTDLSLNSSAMPFTALRAPMATQNVVHNVGDALQQELNRNVYIQGALQTAATAPAAQGKRPIFMEIYSNLAEEFPWEALFHNAATDFFACRAISPVGRLAGGSYLATRWLDGTAIGRRPVLRVLAVLAAQNVPARGEWDALNAARNQANATRTFEMDLDVVVHEQALLQHIQGLGVPAAPLVSKQTLADRIRLFKPHIVHFFCHGSNVGSPHLQLGTNSGTPITYTVSELKNDLQKVELELWMAVLNCCSLGKTTGSGSFARHLVGSDVAVVVGMAEPINSQFAHVFCKAYYREVVIKIDSNFPNIGQSAPVEWVEATVPARRDVLEDQTGANYTTQNASDHKEWTLPVFYTVADEFRFGFTDRAGSQASPAQAVVRKAVPSLAGIPELPQPLRDELYGSMESK